MVFEQAIQSLEYLGIADTLLPFLLVFTIVYAVLEKASIFGQEKKNVNMIIALVVGLSVVIPHVTNSYPSEMDVVNMINIVLPQISLVAVAFIMVLVLAGIFGANWIGEDISGVMALVGAIFVFIIFGNAAGWWDGGNWFYSVFGPDTMSVVLMLVVFGLIIWFITKKDEAPLSKGIKGLFKFLKGES